MRDRFIDEAVERGCIRAFNHASHHVALALHGTDHNQLSRSASAAEVSTSALAFVLVLGLPADIGFIHFDIADQFLKFDIAQRHADFGAHEPCGFVGAEAHVAADLKGADALLAGQHQVNDAEPFTERLVGVLEDRSDQDREAIANLPASTGSIASGIPSYGDGRCHCCSADSARLPASGSASDMSRRPRHLETDARNLQSTSDGFAGCSFVFSAWPGLPWCGASMPC